MADGVRSGLSSGTNGEPQTTLENNELQAKSRENEQNVNVAPDFYGRESGKILPAEYKDWIGVNRRDAMLKKAKNKTLRNAVSELYRSKSFIGDGGTASVIKFEKKTGLGLGKNGGNHQQKGRDMIRYIENKVLTQNLSPSDRKLANELVKKLRKALGGK